MQILLFIQEENILADENTEKDYEKAAKQKGPKTVKSVDKYEANKGTRDTKRINQIKEKEYIQKFRDANKNKKILAVAICYDSKNKEHKCKIEEI